MENNNEAKEPTKRTKLNQHDKVGTQLKPPFAKLDNISFSSWKDERMPDMLWAALAVGNWDREIALNFFRHISGFVQKNPQCCDISLSGIDTLQTEDRKNLINHILEFPNALNLLRSLLLFPDLPAYKDWSDALESPNPDDDWNKIAQGVLKTLDHQSQEATDCRWVKFLCEILGGQMKFPQEMEGKIRAIFNYPNEGDLREIRPFIRAAEIAQKMQQKSNHWPKAFWNTSYLSTFCIPLPSLEKSEGVKKVLGLDDVERIHMYLLEHFVKTNDTTALDPKHHTVFALAFYSLRLINEVTATNLFRGALSRLVLRTLTEVLITLKYLTKENREDLWLKYCEYGDAQAKLTSLKMDEFKDIPAFINEQMVREIANGNKWEEFITIELGHWDKTDLRKLSIEADCKETYDKYYPWASCFTHGNLAAVRESVMGYCANPVHRLHHIPNVRTMPLSSSLDDLVIIVNQILDLVHITYPDFNERIAPKDEPLQEN